MTFHIRAMGMEPTPAIQSYVEEKLTGLEKFYDGIIHIEVDLGKDTNHHNKGDIFTCIAMVQVPGDMLRVEKTEEDLYKAIDKVRDHLREMLVERKERMREERRQVEGE